MKPASDVIPPTFIGKPQKRSCATCCWFAPDRGGIGRCLVDPPVVQVIMPPPSPVTGKMQPAVQGLRPPTNETDRCSRWETI